MVETGRNEIVGGAGGFGFGGFGGGGILEGLIFGSLLGNRRGGGLFGGGDCGNGGEVEAGDIAARVVALQNSADLKQEIADVKAAVIADNQGVLSTLQSAICESNKAALAAMYESKISALQSTNEITNKIGNVETEIQSVKCHVDSKIAASTQAILGVIAADKLDSKNDEIAQLRSRNNAMEQNIQFSALTSVVSNLANQTQHLSNQVVQFGAGNTAIPVATNNQVR